MSSNCHAMTRVSAGVAAVAGVAENATTRARTNANHLFMANLLLEKGFAMRATAIIHGDRC